MPAPQTLRGLLSGAARRTLLRPGAVRTVPAGLARGVRLEVSPDSTLHVHLGSAEVELVRWLRRLAVPGTPCADVGASEGLYALTLAKLVRAPVAALEFRPEALALLRRNLDRNPELARHVRVVEAYAADVVDPAHGATTLDGLVARGALPEPGLLKVDVEGAEVAVLRGARELLARRRPHVLLETHSAGLEQACGELLVRHGYRPVVVHQRRVLKEGRPNPENRWLVAEGRPA
ncbi:FkbM family methyltransferase [Conexibacter sp. SYSU D00693]|uniref:FkbM family methyltransferase n=1 Tax=Conexibacter sp. SYSU D00693 TaxID=2812560 RepID=UPI00196B0145|nr:FkbM family methyltransferase [Conexibacter sp. SYSU D00693]